MQIEILTPDTELFKGEIESVSLPGINGYFGILNNHAPLIAALGKGTVAIKGSKNATGSLITKQNTNDAEFTFDIKGGMVELKNNKVIVLAD